MNRDNLLIRDFIGKDTNWGERENAEAFLKAFVAEIEPNAQIKVSNEDYSIKEQYTVRLRIGNDERTIQVSFEELVNCNSVRAGAAAESQKEMAEKIRRALGEMGGGQRRLGFVK